MMNVSHSRSASSDGAVPSNPMPPVVDGRRSGIAALPNSAFAIQAATPEQHRDLRTFVDDVGRLLKAVVCTGRECA
jgi:hypothetical protein